MTRTPTRSPSNYSSERVTRSGRYLSPSPITRNLNQTPVTPIRSRTRNNVDLSARRDLSSEFDDAPRTPSPVRRVLVTPMAPLRNRREVNIVTPDIRRELFPQTNIQRVDARFQTPPRVRSVSIDNQEFVSPFTHMAGQVAPGTPSAFETEFIEAHVEIDTIAEARELVLVTADQETFEAIEFLRTIEWTPASVRAIPVMEVSPATPERLITRAYVTPATRETRTRIASSLETVRRALYRIPDLNDLPRQ